MGCSAIEPMLAIITWVLSIFQQILPPEFHWSRAISQHFRNQSAAKMNMDGSVLDSDMKIDLSRQEARKKKTTKIPQTPAESL